MDLRFDYVAYNYSLITNKNDFFRTSHPEISKLRTLHNSCATLFKVPQNAISIEMSMQEGLPKVYKLVVTNRTIGEICVLFYIPKELRLDLYEPSMAAPLIAWKNRRCVWKNYSELLKILNLERLFQTLIAGI